MKKYLIISLLLLASLTLLCLASCDTEAPADTEITPTEAPNETPTEPITEEETTMEEITTEEITTEEVTTEAVTETPQGGEGHGIVRDGTPKKYITIRMDDGITQDGRMIEIMKKYGVDCCTFYINTGLYGANWAWVGESSGRPDVTHIRYTRKELQSGIYDGFDVECHTVNHPSLKNYTPPAPARAFPTPWPGLPAPRRRIPRGWQADCG